MFRLAEAIDGSEGVMALEKSSSKRDERGVVVGFTDEDATHGKRCKKGKYHKRTKKLLPAQSKNPSFQ